MGNLESPAYPGQNTASHIAVVIARFIGAFRPNSIYGYSVARSVVDSVLLPTRSSIWEYCWRGTVVARISATTPGSRERARGMAVPRSFLGRIPSILPGNRLGHDSHDANMLCSRVCGSIPKKYMAGRRGPFFCEQRIPDPDRARDCPLLTRGGRFVLS